MTRDGWQPGVESNQLQPDERYRRDPAFRQFVDIMEHMIETARYTGTECREGAILASIHYEQRRPPEPIWVDLATRQIMSRQELERLMMREQAERERERPATVDLQLVEPTPAHVHLTGVSGARQFWRSISDPDGMRWHWIEQCPCGHEGVGPAEHRGPALVMEPPGA